MTATILVGDVRDRLRDLPDASVQMVCTSPPYYNLRDYGAPGQIGLEPTLGDYIATLVDVFREVWRVLRDNGVVFLNLGDSYAANRSYQVTDNKHRDVGNNSGMRVPNGLKSKDLMMVPARVALALQADGWYLRSDIIWHKKAPMPESVTDRPTSAHEHIFLLTKSSRYFYDAEAVREPLIKGVAGSTFTGGKTGINGLGRVSQKERDGNPAGRNLRNVWTLGPEPFPDAHFATFVTEIPRRCIKAGTSERGCCATCGAPWVRVMETVVRAGHKPRLDEQRFKGGSGEHPSSVRRCHGWQPGCTCEAGEPIPCTVLDPFGGSGTVGLVADQLGRDSILIELNPTYAEMARKRIAGDAPMFADVDVLPVGVPA